VIINKYSVVMYQYINPLQESNKLCTI